MKHMKQFVVVVLVAICIPLMAGILDGLKTIGNGVADVARGAVDAAANVSTSAYGVAVNAATNAYQTVKDRTESGSATQVTNVVVGVKPTSDGAVLPAKAGSEEDEAKEIAVTYLCGEFKEKAEALITLDNKRGGSRYGGETAILYSRYIKIKPIGKTERVYRNAYAGMPNLIASGGALLPLTKDGANSWISEVRRAMENEAGYWHKSERKSSRNPVESGAPQPSDVSRRRNQGLCTEESHLDLQGSTTRTSREMANGLQTESARIRVGASRNTSLKSQFADVELSNRYVSFLRQFEDAREDFRQMAKKVCDSKNYQSRDDYYISPRGVYETVRVRSDYVTTGRRVRDVGFKSKILVDECSCPRAERDFIAWTNDILSTLNQDVKTIKMVVERREPFYAFLPEWEKLQLDYESLLKRFGIANAEFLGVRATGEEVGNEQDSRHSYLFKNRLKAFFGCKKGDYICPGTKEELAKWIADIRALYDQKSAGYRARVADVENELASIGAGSDVAEGESKDGSGDFAALLLEDHDGFFALQKAVKAILDAGKELPREVDAYLADEARLNELRNVSAKVRAVNDKVAQAVSNLHARVKAAEVAVLAARGGTPVTNGMHIAGCEFGATRYSLAKTISEGKYQVESFANGMMSYTLESVSKYPAIGNVQLVFAQTALTQDMYLVEGAYEFKEEIPYEEVVRSYKSRLSQKPHENVEKKIVGYQVDELRSRNPWAAWQYNYYAKREHELSGMGDVDGAAKQRKVRQSVVDRYSVKPLIVSVTTLSADGYEMEVWSDVKEQNAMKVFIRDKVLMPKQP